MKKGQTYKINGTQCAMMPFTKMKITQAENGTYSHAGAMAWDVTSGTAGNKAAYYAPCDMKCVAVNKQYAFVWWQSTSKVQTAKHGKTYITIMVGHDEDINATVGMTVKQGEQIANMGAGGTATGVHAHIEVSPTQEKTWVANSKGTYVLPNGVLPSEIFFMDDTEIVGSYKYDWKYMKDVTTTSATSTTSTSSSSSCPFKSSGTLKALYDNIIVRSAPKVADSTKTGYVYNKDMTVNYSSVECSNGYWWAKYTSTSKETRYIALCKSDGTSKFWKQV